jgi:hypothetical protein
LLLGFDEFLGLAGEGDALVEGLGTMLQDEGLVHLAPVGGAVALDAKDEAVGRFIPPHLHVIYGLVADGAVDAGDHQPSGSASFVITKRE